MFILQFLLVELIQEHSQQSNLIGSAVEDKADDFQHPGPSEQHRDKKLNSVISKDHLVLPVHHDGEGHQGVVDGGEPLARVPHSQHQLGAGESGVDLPPVEDGGDVTDRAALPGDEVVSHHLGGGPPLRHGQPEGVALRVVDFIQEVHAVVGDSGQENTEGCLEAGGSSSGEANADQLDSLGHL